MHAHVHEGHRGGSSFPKEEFSWKEPPMTQPALSSSKLRRGCLYGRQQPPPPPVRRWLKALI